MEFPTFLYRCPGPHFGPSGTTYGTLDVASQKELDAALRDGWHLALHDAVQSHIGTSEPVHHPVEDESEDDSPPTRDEMLEQAEKLGIKVDRRWSDDTLMDKINAVMNSANPV